MERVNKTKIEKTQFINQSGFTPKRSIKTNLDRLWSVIDDVRKNNRQMNIASIDIKAAYDNVSHEYLFRMLNIWRRLGFNSRETLTYIRFLYSEYKLGIVEGKGKTMDKICLIN